ncbi:MAG: hypothetical protein IKA76_03745 [Clostridia bacterium]|nr:hypothetical protein [Clostridia bacterium]
MITQSLNGIWHLRGKRQGIEEDPLLNLSATVPGCVQLDLSREGYLPADLYMGENILETERFEDYEWWYERSFTAPAEKKNVFLVFEGVDCLAEYFLNGVKIGESDNMFIAHEFCLDGYLKEGENTLTVHLRSALVEAQDKDYTLKMLTDSHGRYEKRYLRKPNHSYGWDIMPRAVTAGLWREVRLEVRDAIYPTQTFFRFFRNQIRFFYTLACDFRDLADAELELVGSCGEDSQFEARFSDLKKFGQLTFSIPNPKKWFPYGYGEPNVYDGFLRIYKAGKLIHEESFSFGIRDVVLDRRPSFGNDEGQFRFLVNGVEVMCKGTNWVPLDAFHSRDAERLDRALELLKDIGCNIVRCWGGNVYEDHKFFDFCDRNGIMVWQDFAMACVYPPETEEFKKALEKEATFIIRKLRNHPSLVVWCGDNEIDSCARPEYNPNTNPLTREVLPKCVELNDIGRPYLPSSPYISAEEYRAGYRAQMLGSRLVEDHLWGPRDYYKSEFYKSNLAHFVSETGYHGCTSWESVKKFITSENLWGDITNPEWVLHSSDQKGNSARILLLAEHLKQLFGRVPEDPETFVLASQISQAEADKYFIERMRVNRPRKTGIIWWNLLDGWPQFSDAVVDYYFEKKIAYSYIKRAQAPFTVAADELVNWKLPIYACNDTLDVKNGHLTVKDAETEKILYEGEFTAKENASTLITALPVYYSEHKILIFEWDVNGERGFNHYLCGFPPFSLDFYRKIMNRYGL